MLCSCISSRGQAIKQSNKLASRAQASPAEHTLSRKRPVQAGKMQRQHQLVLAPGGQATLQECHADHTTSSETSTTKLDWHHNSASLSNPSCYLLPNSDELPTQQTANWACPYPTQAAHFCMSSHQLLHHTGCSNPLRLSSQVYSFLLCSPSPCPLLIQIRIKPRVQSIPVRRLLFRALTLPTRCSSRCCTPCSSTPRP